MTTPASTRLPIPGAYQMTVKMTVAGQDAAIVLGAKGVSGGGWIDLPTAETWRNEAWANLRGGMLDDVVCTGAIVRYTDGPEVYELGAPPSPSGFVTGSPGLLAGATLIKWGTAQGGRSGKGRTFLPGLAAANINADGRTLVSGYQSSVQAYINSYLNSSALATKGIAPAVLSFSKGASYRITSGSVASVVGLQRRRMR